MGSRAGVQRLRTNRRGRFDAIDKNLEDSCPCFLSKFFATAPSWGMCVHRTDRDARADGRLGHRRGSRQVTRPFPLILSMYFLFQGPGLLYSPSFVSLGPCARFFVPLILFLPPSLLSFFRARLEAQERRVLRNHLRRRYSHPLLDKIAGEVVFDGHRWHTWLGGLSLLINLAFFLSWYAVSSTAAAKKKRGKKLAHGQKAD